MKLATLGFAFVAAFAFAVGAIELTDLERAALGVTIAAFGISLILPLAAETWREVP